MFSITTFARQIYPTTQYAAYKYIYIYMQANADCEVITNNNKCSLFFFFVAVFAFFMQIGYNRSIFQTGYTEKIGLLNQINRMKSDHNGLDVELRDLVEGTEGQDKGGHLTACTLDGQIPTPVVLPSQGVFPADRLCVSECVCVCLRGVSPVWHTLSRTLVILLILAIYTFL